MNKMKYNILIWANDAGKFAKEFQETKLGVEVENVYILGDELKITDIKMLQQIPNFNPEIDNIYSNDKKSTELVIIGRCYEQSKITNTEIGLITYTSLDKEVQDIAKNMNIEILNWNAILKQTNTKKNISKTTSSKQSENKKEPPKIETDIKINFPKKETTPRTSRKSNTEKTIKSYITNSNLSKADKTFFQKDENILAIKDAIKNASDIKIGLPFQLQMRFGNNGSKIEQIAKELFNSIRKES